MKKLILTSALAVGAMLSAATLQAAPAMAFTFAYDNIPSNNTNGDAFVNQFTTKITQSGNKVLFQIMNGLTNLAPNPISSTITSVSFENPNNLFTGITLGNSTSGVSFEIDDAPELPQGNNIGFNPAFGVIRTNRGGVVNGVDVGETLNVLLSLNSGKTIDDVIEALDAGTFRVGLHVQRIGGAGGESDSFVSIPTPALLPGLIGLGFTALRKRDNKGEESAEA